MIRVNTELAATHVLDLTSEIQLYLDQPVSTDLNYYLNDTGRDLRTIVMLDFFEGKYGFATNGQVVTFRVYIGDSSSFASDGLVASKTYEWTQADTDHPIITLDLSDTVIPNGQYLIITAHSADGTDLGVRQGVGHTRIDSIVDAVAVSSSYHPKMDVFSIGEEAPDNHSFSPR